MGLSGWQYCANINIDNTGNSNALSDYQQKVVLSSSNFDFSKANSDGSDIRFLDNDDSTLLSYWIESWDSSGQTATIWVKVPSIPASSNYTIYMYFGNASATSASNGNATFEFFDDFSGDLSKWTVISGTDFSISNGVLVVQKTTTTEPKDTIRSNTLIGKEGIIEYKIKPASGSDIAATLWVTGASNQAFWIAPHNGANIYYWNGAGWTRIASGTSYRTAGVWNDEKVIFTSDGNIEAYTNGNLAVSTTGQTPISGYVGVRLGAPTINYIDDFRVRKYTSPEPTTSVGTIRTVSNAIFFGCNF